MRIRLPHKRKIEIDPLAQKAGIGIEYITGWGRKQEDSKDVSDGFAYLPLFSALAACNISEHSTRLRWSAQPISYGLFMSPCEW